MLVPPPGTVDFSSELAMLIDSNASVDDRAVIAKCVDPHRVKNGLETLVPSVFGIWRYFVLRGDKSLDFQTAPLRPKAQLKDSPFLNVEPLNFCEKFDQKLNSTTLESIFKRYLTTWQKYWESILELQTHAWRR